MAVVTEITDIQRAIERLYGILKGISIDRKLRAAEIEALNDWLKVHEDLHNLEPFRSTRFLIERCLADHTIDADEHEEILEWCSQFDAQFSLPDTMTTAIRRLHGVLNGIGIDGVIEQGEVWGLRDWLQNYDTFKHHWPFSHTWTLVGRILEDGKVTEEEKKELLDFCRRFVEDVKVTLQVSGDGDSETAITNASMLKSFDEHCDRTSEISFDGKVFCFSGIARTGPRKALHNIVKSLGGIPSRDLAPYVDYLVIGALSSSCWAYSSYGIKIEKVFDYRNKGVIITILHEDDFITQAKKAGLRLGENRIED